MAIMIGEVRESVLKACMQSAFGNDLGYRVKYGKSAGPCEVRIQLETGEVFNLKISKRKKF